MEDYPQFSVNKVRSPAINRKVRVMRRYLFAYLCYPLCGPTHLVMDAFLVDCFSLNITLLRNRCKKFIPSPRDHAFAVP